MNEETNILQDNNIDSDQDSVTTAGDLLRSMRQASNQEVECIASVLKVSPAKLYALEANDFGEDPTLYFSRALAARVCRHLNQDPTEVLARMPVALSKPMTSIARPHKLQPMKPTPITKRSRMSLWIGIVLVFLVLATASMYALPWVQKYMTNVQEQNTAPKSPTSPNKIVSLSAIPREKITQINQKGVLKFSATGKTWIKVSSPENKIIYEAQLDKGKSHELNIVQYPVNLVVGNVKNTHILHNKQELDLSQYDKQNVARIKLNSEPKTTSQIN